MIKYMLVPFVVLWVTFYIGSFIFDPSSGVRWFTVPALATGGAAILWSIAWAWMKIDGDL